MLKLRTARKSECILSVSVVLWMATYTCAAPAGNAADHAVLTAAIHALPLAPAQGTAGSSAAQGTPITFEQLLWHIPDPEINRKGAFDRRDAATKAGEQALAKRITRILGHADVIRRDEKLHLTLEDALHRALENSYAISLARFDPAVETTRVVEAESAFDALFFTNMTRDKVDRPTGSQLTSGNVDIFILRSGLRKLLPTGMTTSATYGLSRSKIDLSFQQINPEYISKLVLEMQQPLLRGFGIDHNRSLISIAKNDRRMSDWAFRRQVRDILREVEEAYWRLVQARREIVITARELSGFEAIYEYLEARKDFDVIPVQLAATKADLERSRADFVLKCAAVFDAEDQLISRMNAPDIDLADGIEIIPADSLHVEHIVVDRLAEAQTALDNRPEIKEDELVVANAKIGVDRAKNAELPKLDLTFRYTIDGLAGTADKSFDELSRHKFVEYFVGVELEVPIGNRGPRAASKRARLQHEQAVTRLKLRFEEVILDANLAVRKLSSTYDQLGPSFESVQAREREIDSIVARAERMDINTLRNELNARQLLANSRSALLSALVDYNIAIIDLERAKGTLLRHYNVVIAPSAD